MPTPDVPANPAPEGAKATLLLLDDEPSVLNALRRLFRAPGYKVLQSTSAAEALGLLRDNPVDLVISDMRMPEMDGAHFLEAVRLHDPSVVRMLLTGFSDISSTIAAINKGEIHRYIAKPWDDQDLLRAVREALAQRNLVQENARLQQLSTSQNEALRELNLTLEARVAARTAELEQVNGMLNTAYDEVSHNFDLAVMVFASLIEMRQDGMAGHSRRVALLARRVAERLGLSEKERREVYLAAQLHDIGKIGFPDRMLGQPVSTYGPDSMSRYRHHPIDGEAALLPLPQMRGVATIVRQHHERLDGRGFPDGLAGDEIVLGARIVSAASDYDDLLSGAASTGHHTPELAQKVLRGSVGTHYDAHVVEALLAVLAEMAADAAADVALGPDQLLPGMVLAQDLASPKGQVLLPGGVRLDERTITQVKNFALRAGQAPRLHIRRDSMPPAAPAPPAHVHTHTAHP
ncbi:MAG: response regulator [Burkholderiales bacterium]|nr:response regulator [Burkholderiales bacterium]